MTPRVHDCLHCKPFILPMMVFIPEPSWGVLFQQHHVVAGGRPPKK